MKITKFNKTIAACSALLLFSSLASAANATASMTNASIKKDSDFAVASKSGFLPDEEEIQQSGTSGNQNEKNDEEEPKPEEKVAEADTEPENAEVTENPEYKNRIGKIEDGEVMDSETLPQAKDEETRANDEKIAKKEETKPEPKAEPERKIPEYKGSYGGSIRTIRPKSVAVTDEEPKENAVPSAEAANETDSTTTVAEMSDEEQTAETEQAVEIPEIVPSRSVAMKNGQYLEVTYPGKGWSFLGDDESKELMVFNGRRLSKEDTTFTLRSKKPGETLLHFYKIDLLTGQYIDDYLAVSVSEEMAQGDEKNEKVIAPLYAEYVPPRPDRARTENIAEQASSTTKAEEPKRAAEKEQKPAAVETAKKGDGKDEAENQSQTSDKKVKTNIQTAKASQKEQPKKSDTRPAKAEPNNKEEPIAANASAARQQEEKAEPVKVAETAADTGAKKEQGQPEKDVASVESDAETGDLFARAKKAYAEKRYKDALDLAQAYLDVSVNDTDEVLYLLGQIWEAESAVKNIKSSINSYDALVKNYPMSNLWRKANQRLVYLKRFYVDIR